MKNVVKPLSSLEIVMEETFKPNMQLASNDEKPLVLSPVRRTNSRLKLGISNS